MKKIILISLLSLGLNITAYASENAENKTEGSNESAQTSLSQKDLVGIFLANPNISGPYYPVQLIIKDDGTYNLRAATMDSTMPKTRLQWHLHIYRKPVYGNLGLFRY